MADLTITATDVNIVSDSFAERVLAGESLTPGQAVYQNASDLKYYKADCDTVSTATVSGVCVSYAAADAYVYILNSLNSVIDIGATVSVGEIYVVSDTAGNIMPNTDLTSGQYVSVIGYGSDTNEITMNIYNSGVAHV